MKVIIRLSGGLGNQLHQFAYFVSLKLANVQEVVFDTSSYQNIFQLLNNDTKRNLDIIKFNLNISYKNYFLSNSLFRIIKRFNLINYILLNIFGIQIIFNKTDKINNNAKVIYIFNLFGSEQEYRVVYDKINDLLLTNSNINTNSFDNNIVSIHIRRTDYLKKGSVHRVLNIEYYIKAIEIIKSKIDNPKFYILSDDIDWVTNNFKIDGFSYEVYNSKSAIQDFTFLCNSKNIIAANSTFSWWASYLNYKNKNIIIIPRNWYIDSRNILDNYPSNWYLI